MKYFFTRAYLHEQLMSPTWAGLLNFLSISGCLGWLKGSKFPLSYDFIILFQPSVSEPESEPEPETRRRKKKDKRREQSDDSDDADVSSPPHKKGKRDKKKVDYWFF